METVISASASDLGITAGECVCDRAEALHFYEAGSWGPAAAENVKKGMNSIQT